jgi:hypothetical protein
MNQLRPARTYGLATASPETRKRVATIATEARQKAFELYRENKKREERAKAKAQPKTK